MHTNSGPEHVDLDRSHENEVLQGKAAELSLEGPGAAQLQAYQEMADGSQQARQLKSYMDMAEQGVGAQQSVEQIAQRRAVLQMMKEEEKPHQMKSAVQLMKEEEKPKQMKSAVQLMKEEEPKQMKSTVQLMKEEEEPTQKRSVAQRKPNNTGMPDHLKSGIESLSGMDMGDVKVHYNSSQPSQLQAHAYTQGTNIHVAPGQEQHLAHEAWHVVQQKQGRVQPTMDVGGVPVNDDKGLEKEADVMGDKANSL